MQEINAKFKDLPPEQTIRIIQQRLAAVGIELEETWTESGIDDCVSVHVSMKGAYPFFSNGKGVTLELARASAYGEFIERLQCGLFLYKYQSITRDPAMDLQTHAPDGKFMTLQEIIEGGHWMDYLIAEYGGGLTRQKLGQLCKDFSCRQDDLIWTLPFYSLFEDKYVYLPAGFMLQLYAANGGCAGNTREEAWIHALSEIMERRCTIDMLTGKRIPGRIPEETVRKYAVPARILDQVRSTGNYDISLLDFSMTPEYPVVATRIVNRQTHEYMINTAADPILEIAIDRALTESFQGRHLNNFMTGNHTNFAEEFPNFPEAHNILNQIELARGHFPMGLFVDGPDAPGCCDFADHSAMNNKELLDYLLDLYRKLGKPVYVRNFSCLGFHSYQFVIPGFSETRTHHLAGGLSEYALGDAVQKTLRNAAAADPGALLMLLNFHAKISTAQSRRMNFVGLAGLPMDNYYNTQLLGITLSYAAYRLGRLKQAISYLALLQRSEKVADEIKGYFACVTRYLELKLQNVPEESIRQILQKFYQPQYVQQLYSHLDQGKTPYDGHLVACDTVSCGTCRHQSICAYERCREVLTQVGQVYQQFENGQSKAYLGI